MWMRVEGTERGSGSSETITQRKKVRRTGMNLVDQYLESVARFLTGLPQDDILAELRENIRSHVEDRESEIGRPLTDAELRAILDRLGNPAVVASRYRPEERS